MIYFKDIQSEQLSFEQTLRAQKKQLNRWLKNNEKKGLQIDALLSYTQTMLYKQRVGEALEKLKNQLMKNKEPKEIKKSEISNQLLALWYVLQWDPSLTVDYLNSNNAQINRSQNKDPQQATFNQLIERWVEKLPVLSVTQINAWVGQLGVEFNQEECGVWGTLGVLCKHNKLDLMPWIKNSEYKLSKNIVKKLKSNQSDLTMSSFLSTRKKTEASEKTQAHLSVSGLIFEWLIDNQLGKLLSAPEHDKASSGEALLNWQLSEYESGARRQLVVSEQTMEGLDQWIKNQSSVSEKLLAGFETIQVLKCENQALAGDVDQINEKIIEVSALINKLAQSKSKGSVIGFLSNTWQGFKNTIEQKSSRLAGQWSVSLLNAQCPLTVNLQHKLARKESVLELIKAHKQINAALIEKKLGALFSSFNKKNKDCNQWIAGSLTRFKQLTSTEVNIEGISQRIDLLNQWHHCVLQGLKIDDLFIINKHFSEKKISQETIKNDFHIRYSQEAKKPLNRVVFGYCVLFLAHYIPLLERLKDLTDDQMKSVNEKKNRFDDRLQKQYAQLNHKAVHVLLIYLHACIKKYQYFMCNPRKQKGTYEQLGLLKKIQEGVDCLHQVRSKHQDNLKNFKNTDPMVWLDSLKSENSLSQINEKISLELIDLTDDLGQLSWMGIEKDKEAVPWQIKAVVEQMQASVEQSKKSSQSLYASALDETVQKKVKALSLEDFNQWLSGCKSNPWLFEISKNNFFELIKHQLEQIKDQSVHEYHLKTFGRYLVPISDWAGSGAPWDSLLDNWVPQMALKHPHLVGVLGDLMKSNEGEFKPYPNDWIKQIESLGHHQQLQALIEREGGDQPSESGIKTSFSL